MRILVTGGAGFIGSFLVDKLINEGHSVRIFDNLEEQVHQKKMPSYLNKNAEFVNADMNDYEKIKKSIKDIDVIFNLAAMVGVGQSMYQLRRYVIANTLGTASLMEALVNENHDVKKLVVASSMSTYGEGSYECDDCGLVNPPLRTEAQMKKGDWELHCSNCGKLLKPIPTTEEKVQEINSVYALTKKDQEDMSLNIGKTYGIPTVVFRYFNVYGPRQSLNNPYTGVAAIFMSRIKNNNRPLIFEDGRQTRDFISVHDITQANLLGMNKREADYRIFNVGTGKPVTILEIAQIIARLYNKKIEPDITNQFRKGDVRHCIADITKIEKLGFKPKVSFEEGMKELIEWSAKEESVDMVEKATKELKDKGLLS